MANVKLERFTPESTTVLMVDHCLGNLNLARSHSSGHSMRGAIALAKIARLFDAGLVITFARSQEPDPLLVDAVSGHPLIFRAGEFNAFENLDVLQAVRETGSSRLAISGLMTEKSALFTALGALRLGYTVAVVVDAMAGENRDTHDLAVQRMIQAGAVPTTALSLAAEFQNDWDNTKTARGYADLVAASSSSFLHDEVSEWTTPHPQ